MWLWHLGYILFSMCIITVDQTFELEGTLSEEENCNFCFVNASIKIKIFKTTVPQPVVIIESTLINSGSIDGFNFNRLLYPTRIRGNV